MDINNKEHVKNLNWFKNFTKLCNKNNIWYTVTNGTLLGTIREKGAIEWDDDYDVMMTPQSYAQLKKLFPDNCLDASNELEYPLIIPKFVPDRKQFLKNAIFVDIFIVVKSNNKNVRKFRSLRKKLNFTMQVMNSTWVPYAWYIWLYKYISWPFRLLIKKMSYKTAIEILETEQYQYYFSIDNPVDPKKINVIDVLTLTTIDKPFFDFIVKVPIEYDHILIKKYGKYMVPNKWQRPFVHINAISIRRIKKK